MPTTSDYLTSLQNDLSTIVSTLGLQQGTNFTDIKNATLNGDITTGGGASISDYLANSIGTSGTANIKKLFKKIPAFSYSGNSCSSMFSGCSNLKEVDLSLVNVSNVTNFSSMFYDCPELETVDVSNFTSNASAGNFSSMFGYCTKLESINFGDDFDTSMATNMSYMFQGCSNIKELDLHSFDGTYVNNIGYMFQGCSELKKINLSNFNTSQTWSQSSLTNIFSGCKKLEELDMRSFEFTNQTQNVVNRLLYMLSTSVLIIVKDTANKDWILGTLPNLNVKTVAEL